jgi:hypothetical protein
MGAGAMPYGAIPPPMGAPAFMPGMMPGAMPGMMPGMMPGVMPPLAPGFMGFPQQQPMPMYGYPPGIAPQPPNTQGFSYVSGFGGGTRAPQPHPLIDPEIPSANMTNSTGGAGCEPGYNYFFGPEHTKIHVLKTPTPPWELPENFSVPFHACHVPTGVTIGELLKGFGATNPVAKKNRLWEVVQGGNGKWYKGLGFNAGEDADMIKTCKEVGWDSSRSGLPGKKPVVYLYIRKD